eukprot:TRINITY_DN21519_c0_g1_i1.p1 TRINITY_DN21519_c0_g1~~TRINITY_DN21519_c0_g1_i1.p1  ORF type:complete len:382 (+),score=68.26 TRINITY_DN21519_c0_g1_i1:123-1148(+)
MVVCARIDWVRRCILQGQSVSFRCSFNYETATHKVTIRVVQSQTDACIFAMEFMDTLRRYADDPSYVCTDKGHKHSSGESVVQIFYRKRAQHVSCAGAELTPPPDGGEDDQAGEGGEDREEDHGAEGHAPLQRLPPGLGFQGPERHGVPEGGDQALEWLVRQPAGFSWNTTATEFKPLAGGSEGAAGPEAAARYEGEGHLRGSEKQRHRQPLRSILKAASRVEKLQENAADSRSSVVSIPTRPFSTSSRAGGPQNFRDGPEHAEERQADEQKAIAEMEKEALTEQGAVEYGQQQQEYLQTEIARLQQQQEQRDKGENHTLRIDNNEDDELLAAAKALLAGD